MSRTLGRAGETMHWKLKAALQNAISLGPSNLSHATYYWAQRHFGGLKKINPVKRLSAGIEICKRIKRLNYQPQGKVFFEVGTGRAPIVPMAYWLMGAKRIITVDINPYLKGELVKESLQYMEENENEIQSLFGALLDQHRFSELRDFYRSAPFSMEAFLDFLNIEYIAPGDAANTGLSDESIDFHTSHTVLEHIPKEVLVQILKEGNRITVANGLFIHKIDYSDHFSHSDKTISPINFLQYSESEWNKYAGNRYMYMNRLRHDDFIRMFESIKHRILMADPDEDKCVHDLITQGGLKLDARFKNKSIETLSTTGAWIVSKKTKQNLQEHMPINFRGASFGTR
ncbi:class I SAM-dependent methyltransferase [Archangium violaceum]|uniref:hypothetical protein n=1 Tax=Archangium violaceum TaxID=83451 RepID=UPI002B2DBDEA|nr:class I SAM-dependent methyltransferase [Archangium violaceum]